MDSVVVRPGTGGPDISFEVNDARAEVGTFALSGQVSQPSAAAARLADIKTDANSELDQLLAEMEGYTAGPKRDEAAWDCTRHAWRIVGRYREQVTRLNQQPFNIVFEYEAGSRTVKDFCIETREVPISLDVGTLKSEIDTALTVIKSVMEERRSRIGNADWGTGQREVSQRQSEYLTQLGGIAGVGLMTAEPSRAVFARGDLVRLKSLFTVREAGLVKNSYVGRLLLWCGVVTVAFLVCYYAARTLAGPPSPAAGSWAELFYNTRNFHLLAVGTAVGTWLSFSLRREELVFEDLAVLEPDRLNPPTRVLYMVGLASFVGLLLFSNAVIVGVGTVTGLEALHQHGSWALLIGLLAGVAERALGAAIGRRGKDFAASIGGDTPAKVKV